MKYVVRCFYCEKIFVVDRDANGADYICPQCGEANNIKDVVERIEDPPTKKKEADKDIETIKAFDMAQHPVINDGSCDEKKEFKFFKWGEEPDRPEDVFIGIILLIIALIIYIIRG